MQLYLDLDGVLADFDRGHEIAFGYRPDRKLKNHKWELIRSSPTFFQSLPPMGDMQYLWNFAINSICRPIIITGAALNMGTAYAQKHKWVRKHLGKDVPLIVVPSTEKAHFARPGDILVDDWPKYRAMWEAKGAHWVLHTDAESSINQLRELGL